MAERPITPTRIIPGGAPLPGRPPGPDDIPPWRTPPPAPPAPPPPPERIVFLPPPPPPPLPGPVEVRVQFLPVEPPPEPTRWERLRDWITSIAGPWKLSAALAAGLIPIPGIGYSLAGIWTYCVSDTRETFGVPHGYGLAIAVLLFTGRAMLRTRALRWITATVVALVGLIFGALDPFDLVTITTGVTR
ncbi:hypothetical protein ACFVQ4_25035 [Streptomyces laurentii]|uniref:hypothetical protein n=1 Tax=Streptomyces laurentii TaxID=39478 RepID=UPI0036C5D8D0